MVAARSEYLFSSLLHSASRANFTNQKNMPPLDGGSADPERNVALFNAVKKARADGVPKANIESALQKVRARAWGSFDLHIHLFLHFF